MAFADAYDDEEPRMDMQQSVPAQQAPQSPQGLGPGSYAGMMGQQMPAAPPPQGGSQWRPIERPAGQPPVLGAPQAAPAVPYNPDLFQQLDPRLQMQVDELERAGDIIRGDHSTTPAQKIWALRQIDGKLQSLDPSGNYSRSANNLRGTIPDITKAMAQRMQLFPEHGFAVALQPDGKMLFHKLEYPKAAQQQQPWDANELAKSVVVDPRTGHSFIRQPDGKITHVPAKNEGVDKQAEAEQKHQEKLQAMQDKEDKEVHDAYRHWDKEYASHLEKKRGDVEPDPVQISQTRQSKGWHDAIIAKLRTEWGDERVERAFPNERKGGTPANPRSQLRPLGEGLGTNRIDAYKRQRFGTPVGPQQMPNPADYNPFGGPRQ